MFLLKKYGQSQQLFTYKKIKKTDIFTSKNHNPPPQKKEPG